MAIGEFLQSPLDICGRSFYNEPNFKFLMKSNDKNK